jgi:ATP-dependent Clp protease ATP-binding subunit ClpA
MQGNEKHNEGLCLVCAKELGIPQIKEYIDEMGIDEDSLDEIIEEMNPTLGDINESFSPGGTASMPGFLQNLFTSNPFLSGGPAPQPQRKPEQAPPPKKEEKPVKKHKFLDNYCTNLTEKAAKGKLDNIIGRDKEIARAMQILTRRQKNNPCLIGEPGVG